MNDVKGIFGNQDRLLEALPFGTKFTVIVDEDGLILPASIDPKEYSDELLVEVPEDLAMDQFWDYIEFI